MPLDAVVLSIPTANRLKEMLSHYRNPGIRQPENIWRYAGTDLDFVKANGDGTGEVWKYASDDETFDAIGATVTLVSVEGELVAGRYYLALLAGNDEQPIYATIGEASGVRDVRIEADGGALVGGHSPFTFNGLVEPPAVTVTVVEGVSAYRVEAGDYGALVGGSAVVTPTVAGIDYTRNATGGALVGGSATVRYSKAIQSIAITIVDGAIQVIQTTIVFNIDNVTNNYTTSVTNVTTFSLGCVTAGCGIDLTILATGGAKVGGRGATHYSVEGSGGCLVGGSSSAHYSREGSGGALVGGEGESVFNSASTDYFVEASGGALVGGEAVIAFYDACLACAETPIAPPTENLVCWIAGDLSFSGLSDGDPIDLATDQSGAGDDGAQSNPSLQPTYKTGILNGKAVMRFAGGQWLEMVNSWPHPLTVVAVYRFTNDTQGLTILGSDSPGVQYRLVNYPRNDSQQFVKSSSAEETLANAAHFPNRWYITGGSWTTTGGAYYNGICPDGSVSGDTPNTTTAAQLGKSAASETWVGDIAEVLVWDTELDSDTVEEAICYLAGKWALTINGGNYFFGASGGALVGGSGSTHYSYAGEGGASVGGSSPTHYFIEASGGALVGGSTVGNPVTSGLVFSVFANDILGLSTTDPVATWSDHNAGGDFTASSTREPTFRATDGPNSLPCVRFDGSNDILQSSFSLNTTPVTVIVVAKLSTMLVPYGGSGNAFVFNFSSGHADQYAGGTLTFNITPTNWFIMTNVFDGASSVARVNGTETSGNCGTATTVGDNVNVGAWDVAHGYYCTGDYFAVLGYNRALDSSERAAVETWLNSLTMIF